MFAEGAWALGRSGKEIMYNRPPAENGVLVESAALRQSEGSATEPPVVRIVPVDDDSLALVSALIHPANSGAAPDQVALLAHIEMPDAALIPTALVTTADLDAVLTVGIASSTAKVVLRAMSTALHAPHEAGATTIAVFLLPPCFDARPAVAEIGHFANALLLLPENCEPATVRQVLAAYALTCASGVDVPIGAEFLDLRQAFDKTGDAFLGIGFASGNDRARRAAEIAISAIPKGSLEASAGLAIMVAGNRSLRLQEVAEAVFAVHNASAGDANGALAAHYDDRLNNRVRVTVIAAPWKDE